MLVLQPPVEAAAGRHRVEHDVALAQPQRLGRGAAGELGRLAGDPQLELAVGKPRAWVDELAADEAILLAAKVIEVNADFFTRTVMPRLNGEMGGLIARTSAAAAAVTAGSTPSST